MNLLTPTINGDLENDVGVSPCNKTAKGEILKDMYASPIQDDYDTEARLASLNPPMVSLSKFWTDISVKNISKYLILFFDIPINLLLWGC